MSLSRYTRLFHSTPPHPSLSSVSAFIHFFKIYLFIYFYCFSVFYFGRDPSEGLILLLSVLSFPHVSFVIYHRRDSRIHVLVVALSLSEPDALLLFAALFFFTFTWHFFLARELSNGATWALKKFFCATLEHVKLLPVEHVDSRRFLNSSEQCKKCSSRKPPPGDKHVQHTQKRWRK